MNFLVFDFYAMVMNLLNITQLSKLSDLDNACSLPFRLPLPTKSSLLSCFNIPQFQLSNNIDYQHKPTTLILPFLFLLVPS